MVFQPGKSGNPAGRQTGTRVKINEKFLSALLKDFEKGGAKAIEQVRLKSPGTYLRALVALQPTKFEGDVNVSDARPPEGDATGDQLVAAIVDGINGLAGPGGDTDGVSVARSNGSRVSDRSGNGKTRH